MSFAAPLGFDGFTLNRIRNAISLHRQGIFIESSTLAVSILSFPPILAAVAQRLAPVLALPRIVRAGTTGLSRILGDAIEAQVAPRSGLEPSPYVPATLWGATAFDRAMMGFFVLQHVAGAPDEETGIVPLYTRRWPTWAVQYYRYRRTYVAITDSGPVDILNDGKFTLGADAEEGLYEGAIVALGEEAFDGMATKRARASWIDRYGNPKLIGKMPANVGVNTPEGIALFNALGTIRGPDGFGVLPNGASLEWTALAASQSTALDTALASNVMMVAIALLGQDGTMSKGGGGVYTSPTYEGIARTLVDRDLKTQVRTINVGHVKTWLDFNYRETIRATPDWVEPVLDIPLPDPTADERMKSLAERTARRAELIASEKNVGFNVTQTRVDQLSRELGLETITLAEASSVPVARLDLAPTDIAKVVKVDEARRSRELGPIGDERGQLTISELDAQAKIDPVALPAAPTEPSEKNTAPENTP